MPGRHFGIPLRTQPRPTYSSLTAARCLERQRFHRGYRNHSDGIGSCPLRAEQDCREG
jgi:hypothetical protein